MSFANPLGFLLLTAVPVIVLLHLFRQERRRELVSSLYLWREISDQSSRRIRPRLLRNIHLLLQLLAVIAAAFALSEPSRVRSGITGADQLILVLDTSASMQAQTRGESSFSLAVRRASALAASSRSERVTLVGTGESPSVFLAPTTNMQSVSDTLAALLPTGGTNNLDRLADLITGLEGGRNSDVVLITDASGASRITEFERWPTRYVVEQVGTTAANRGITAFELRERPDGGETEALIGVSNFGPQAATLSLRLTVEGEEYAREALSLEPFEERLLTATFPGVRGTFSGELVGNEDALPIDDVAFATSGSERPVRVQLVTNGNLFLESFFSIFPETELTVTNEVSRPREYDLIVLDGVPAPARLQGNVITVGTALPEGPFQAERAVQVDRAVATVVHPITENAELPQVQVSAAIAGTLDPRATVLANAGEIPLIYAWRGESVSVVGFLFDLRDSDIALRGSFPILMSNIISWLAPTGEAAGAGYVASGSVVPLYVPPGEAVLVVQPDETPLRFQPRTSPFEFADTEQVGVYRVLGESFTSRFAVSVASREESRLIPETPAVEQERELPGARSGDTDRAGRPLWHLFALAALLVLAGDWIIWARRT